MNGRKKISTLNLILIVQLVIMIILSMVITKTISRTTKNNSIEHMLTITDERATIIQNYVINAEKTLTYYSKAEQVTNLLSDTENPEYIEKAQKFTEDYSAEIDNVEGLWIGTWETKCIAHTNKESVGMVTRPKETKAEALKQLQDSLLAAGNGVYNTGIIISPASGRQIVSMYKAVYDADGQPIGFVGLGIYTDNLVKSLDDLSTKGFENSTYCMVNVKDSKYIFNPDSKLVNTVTDSKEIKKLCKSLGGKLTEQDGKFFYEKGGEKYISAYSYIPQYGWILMLDDTKSEVFALTKVMRIYMLIFAVVIIVLMVVFYFINRKQEQVNQKLAASIVKNNKTKDSLYTAMFKDVLTDVNNRVSFSMDTEEMKPTANNPYYFVMFNIADFSAVNSQYGNDTGDWLLVRTVDVLRQVFRGSKIYRTGSDEFVVAVQANSNTADEILDTVKDAYNRLTGRQNSPIGKLQFKFKASVVRKNSDINTSVITVLKDAVNRFTGQITLTDMNQK